jgi:hypothetical protein
MYWKYLAILVILALSTTAAADQSLPMVADPVPTPTIITPGIAEPEESGILKTLKERARIDRKSGLRYNVYEFDGGAEPDTEIYIKGPYVSGKPGIGIMIKF